MATLLASIPAGYGKAIASWQQSGDNAPFHTTWGFTDDGATAAGTIAAGMTTRWSTSWPAGSMATGSTYLGTVVYINRGGTILRGDGPASLAGTWAVTPPASALALIVKKRTATVGKRYRGRMFLPSLGLNRLDVDANGVILAASVTALQTRMSAWLAAEIATPYDPVLIHPPALATAPTPILTLVVSNIAGVQRQRMR